MASDLLMAAASPIIKSIVDNVVTPQVKKYAKECGIAYNSLLIPKGKHFEKYLNRMYEKYSIINTMVFHNSQRLLKDIYIIQTIVKKNLSRVDERKRIDGIPSDLIKMYKKILISDTAGMGKSTIMKRMFIDLIDKGLKDLGIPIYIELNRLNKDHTILNEIYEELNSLSEDFDNDLLLRFIQRGGFIFFMDGYDEIPIADRSEVTKDIQSFISKAGSDNYYILTSRPEDSVASFGSFQLFSIQPLTKDEAFDLLIKYDLSTDKVISNKLIDLLKSGEYSSISEYLENPLLVSLLYAAFDHKQSIPLKKHLFFRQVYDALFESHELVQGHDPHEKRSGLDIDDFNRVLRFVGYECLKRGKSSFDKDLILKIIGNARDYCGNISFKESLFLSDLLLAVPLFCKDGSEFRWVHKSLMEYFAARFISDDAKENQDIILFTIYGSHHVGSYINMLDLYYDIDNKEFSKMITLPLCELFLRFREDQIKNRDTSITQKISEDLIEERIGLLFMAQWAFLWENHNQYSSSFKPRPDLVRKFENHFGNNIRMWDPIKNKEKSIWFANQIKAYSPLVELLYIKRGDLFKKKDDNYSTRILFAKALFTSINGIRQGEVCDISLNQGSNDNMEYITINNLLMEILDYHRINYYFSYQSCELEIQRIEREIAKSNNVSDLLDGI